MQKLQRIKATSFQELPDLPENWGILVCGGLGLEAAGTYGTKEAGYCGADLHLDETGDSPDATEA